MLLPFMSVLGLSKHTATTAFVNPHNNGLHPSVCLLLIWVGVVDAAG